MRHGTSPFLSILQWLPGTGTAAGVFRLLDLICEPITPRQAVAVPADPLPGRPESLTPLLLLVSEDGDLYRQHLFDQYKLVVEMGVEEPVAGGG